MPRKKKEEVSKKELKKEASVEETKETKSVEKPLEEKLIETAEQIAVKSEASKRGFYFGHGRRKTATARARLHLPASEVTISGKKLEKGDIFVNNQPIEKYFSDPFAKALYTEVYRTTNTIGRFITTVITSGSGKTGQLGATVLAISSALVQADPRFRPILRKKGFLTRDPRAKERKKPGLMGARKEKQSPKR